MPTEEAEEVFEPIQNSWGMFGTVQTNNIFPVQQILGDKSKWQNGDHVSHRGKHKDQAKAEVTGPSKTAEDQNINRHKSFESYSSI